MKTTVLYWSRSGNTQLVAEAIADSLRPSGAVDVMQVETAEVDPRTDLLIVGAPTEGHGMPAVVKASLDRLPRLSGMRVAAFDTRLNWPLWLSGSAGRGIADRLQEAGGRLVAPVENFIVTREPKLHEGEIARARQWAQTLVSSGTPTGEPRANGENPTTSEVGHDGDLRLTHIFRAGAAAAIAAIVLVLVNGAVLIFNPIPSTVLGHFQQIQGNALIGMINLDLVMLVSELLLVAVFIALYAALRRANPLAAALGAGVALGGILLYVAINPAFSFLFLSDQYANASTAVQRASLLMQGETLWANYQGTAFAVSYLMAAVATLIFASIMLRSRVFNRATAFTGLVFGATMLVPPIPALGVVGVAISSVSLVPMVVFEALVAWGLLRLAGRGGGVTATPLPLPSTVPPSAAPREARASATRSWRGRAGAR